MWQSPIHLETIRIVRAALLLVKNESISFLEALGQASGGTITSVETLYLRMADVIRACPSNLNVGRSILRAFGQAAAAAGPPIEGGTAAVEAAALVTEATAPAMAGGGLIGALTAIGEWFGFGVGSVTATVAGGVALTAALGLVTYGVSNYAGSHAGDRPILPGPAMSRGDKPVPASKSPGLPVPIGGDRPNPPAARAETETDPALGGSLTGKWSIDGSLDVDVTQTGTEVKGTYNGGWVEGTTSGNEVNLTNNKGNKYKGTVAADGTIDFIPNGGGAGLNHKWVRQ